MTYTLQHETPVGPVTITATGEAVTQIRFGTTVPEGSAAVPATPAPPPLPLLLLPVRHSISC